MRYRIAAFDYDGTIAHHGGVPDEVIEALKRLKASNRVIMLVTGRELDELKSIFPQHTVFDRIVAENGALLYNPATLEEKLLGEKPPESFIEDLRKNNVTPMSVGRVIVATWEPHQHTVLEAIKRSGIERQVIFNKGAVMILPAGINKAFGLKAALKELHYSLHNVVAAGDAENDSAMLQAVEFSVAVQNALPALKESADLVTKSDHGAGIMELVDQVLQDDLASMDDRLTRHFLDLGNRFDGEPFQIKPYGPGILLAGKSGGGKTTLTTFFIESLMAKKYQFCLIDPEGDYSELKNSVTQGNAQTVPVIEEVINLLKNPGENVVVNTLAIPLPDRPHFFNKLLPALTEMRKNLGHPHWLIFDEAHHLMPSTIENSFFNIPQNLNNFMLVTLSPDLINKSVLSQVNHVIAIGDDPGETLSNFATQTEKRSPELEITPLNKGEAWVWQLNNGAPFPIRLERPVQLLQRHKRKYATGDMADNSFYFTGPGKKLNLRANNLMLFMQMAEGVDDDTWTYHLARHDYSNWFRFVVKDDELADLARKVEEQQLDVPASKEALFKLVRERYTAGK